MHFPSLTIFLLLFWSALASAYQHPHAPSPKIQCGIPGEVYLACGACSETTSEAMMSVLRPFLGTQQHLKQHFDWHTLRALGARFSVTHFQEAQASGMIAANENFEDFKGKHVLGGSASGEDFFYMHRSMIKAVQAQLASANLPCIEPWRDLPASVQDDNWPVPRKWLNEQALQKGESDLQLIRKSLNANRNPQWLRSVSLHRLGTVVEPGFHQSLHNFYRGNPLCSREAKAQGYCDDLLPFDTSPLNKHFWKIHGLVDELVGEWLQANGYQEISENCEARAGCYQWKGTWAGGMEHAHHQ